MTDTTFDNVKLTLHGYVSFTQHPIPTTPEGLPNVVAISEPSSVTSARMDPSAPLPSDQTVTVSLAATPKVREYLAPKYIEPTLRLLYPVSTYETIFWCTGVWNANLVGKEFWVGTEKVEILSGKLVDGEDYNPLMSEEDREEVAQVPWGERAVRLRVKRGAGGTVATRIDMPDNVSSAVNPLPEGGIPLRETAPTTVSGLGVAYSYLPRAGGERVLLYGTIKTLVDSGDMIQLTLSTAIEESISQPWYRLEALYPTGVESTYAHWMPAMAREFQVIALSSPFPTVKHWGYSSTLTNNISNGRFVYRPVSATHRWEDIASAPTSLRVPQMFASTGFLSREYPHYRASTIRPFGEEYAPDTVSTTFSHLPTELGGEAGQPYCAAPKWGVDYFDKGLFRSAALLGGDGEFSIQQDAPGNKLGVPNDTPWPTNKEATGERGTEGTVYMMLGLLHFSDLRRDLPDMPQGSVEGWRCSYGVVGLRWTWGPFGKAFSDNYPRLFGRDGSTQVGLTTLRSDAKKRWILRDLKKGVSRDLDFEPKFPGPFAPRRLLAIPSWRINPSVDSSGAHPSAYFTAQMAPHVGCYRIDPDHRATPPDRKLLVGRNLHGVWLREGLLGDSLTAENDLRRLVDRAVKIVRDYVIERRGPLIVPVPPHTGRYPDLSYRYDPETPQIFFPYEIEDIIRDELSLGNVVKHARVDTNVAADADPWAYPPLEFFFERTLKDTFFSDLRVQYAITYVPGPGGALRPLPLWKDLLQPGTISSPVYPIGVKDVRDRDHSITWDFQLPISEVSFSGMPRALTKGLVTWSAIPSGGGTVKDMPPSLDEWESEALPEVIKVQSEYYSTGQNDGRKISLKFSDGYLKRDREPAQSARYGESNLTEMAYLRGGYVTVARVLWERVVRNYGRPYPQVTLRIDGDLQYFPGDLVDITLPNMPGPNGVGVYNMRGQIWERGDNVELGTAEVQILLVGWFDYKEPEEP